MGFLSEDVVKDEADEGEAGAAGDDNEGDDEGEASAAGDDNEEVESPVEESPQPKRARVRKGAIGTGIGDKEAGCRQAARRPTIAFAWTHRA